MSTSARVVSPHSDPSRVIAEDGSLLEIPKGWELLPPGDAGLTRKLKSLGPSFTVKVRRRRRLESRGVWAPAENIAEARRLVAARRDEPGYAREMQRAAQRRGLRQDAYVQDFEQEVLAFLGFAPDHLELGQRLARAVTAHATPVGSGTVARTQRIPVAERAEAAVIAWMRHQTTAYDNLKIPRVKGARRQMRRQLAERSRALLERYRSGAAVAARSCPLQRALDAAEREES